ncbi:MAG TPA: hypothetical protein PLF98_08990, partial [Thermotogota bacterium]|nr:hypothetical protein [Thermotogota bacterium]
MISRERISLKSNSSFHFCFNFSTVSGSTLIEIVTSSPSVSKYREPAGILFSKSHSMIFWNPFFPWTNSMIKRVRFLLKTRPIQKGFQKIIEWLLEN